MRYQWHGNNVNWYKCLKNALLVTWKDENHCVMPQHVMVFIFSGNRNAFFKQ